MEALARAGGPARRADLTAVNLAARLEDAQQIVVPRAGARRPPRRPPQRARPRPPPAASSASRRPPSSSSTRSTGSAPRSPSGSSTTARPTAASAPSTSSARSRASATSASPASATASSREVQTVGAALARCRPHVPLGAAAIGLLLAPSPSLALPAALILAAALALARAPATGAMAAAARGRRNPRRGGPAGGDRRRRGAGCRSAAAVYADAVVLERPRPTRFGSRAPLRVIDGAAAGAPVMARAGSSLHWPRDTRPGAIVAVRGRVRRPPARGPGAAGYRAHLRRRGIAAELRLVRVRRRAGGAAGSPVRSTRSAVAPRTRSRPACPRPRPRSLRGMVLGQDERIDELTRDDWRDSGLAHLLAVSGQNVMLLGALALPLLVAAGAGRRARIGRSARADRASTCRSPARARRSSAPA